MPGSATVDFPLDPQEDDSDDDNSDDDVTVVGYDEQEAAARSIPQEEVSRQEAPRQDVPVSKEKVNYDPNAPEIITIED